jgi:hypothetical protein
VCVCVCVCGLFFVFEFIVTFSTCNICVHMYWCMCMKHIGRLTKFNYKCSFFLFGKRYVPSRLYFIISVIISVLLIYYSVYVQKSLHGNLRNIFVVGGAYLHFKFLGSCTSALAHKHVSFL